MEEMSIEDIMREIPPEDLQHVGSVKDRVYMPVSFVQKWVLSTIRVQKALKESQDGKLPGGMEPAFLASIFDQSVMDFNKPVSTNLADNRALRSMVIHTKDDTTHQFVPMEEGIKDLINGVKSALQRLKKVAQLPDENTLFQMKDVEIDIHNKEIDEAIEQYGDHATRDQNNILLIREQNALVGRLAWEQHIRICDLNERHLRLLEEKRQLVQMNDKHIYDSVNIITLTMIQLKESLKERDSSVSKILIPIDFKEIMATMAKLRSALRDINLSNSHLVTRNNALNLGLSFMPRKMREHLEQAKRSHSTVVANQRTDPHHLIPDGTKYVFQRADPNDPIVSQLQRCSHFSSVNQPFKRSG
jgi:hypothetical protein